GAKAASAAVPTFEYDPTWPKPLPHNWNLGNIGWMAIDPKQHVWIAHRPGSINGLFENAALNGEGECCTPAPPIVELDQAGNLVQAWGPIHNANGELMGEQVSGPHPELVWPASAH